jgi:hypothetical protein
LDGWNEHRWENWELILQLMERIELAWREAHRLEKNWHDNLERLEGLALPQKYESTA